MKLITSACLFVLLQISLVAQARHQFESVAVPLSDGVEARGDLYLPPGDGPFPLVLEITPYSRAQDKIYGVTFAREGYATLIQSVRGKGGSGGVFLPFVDEIPDLLAILEWCLEQSWCDGSVALMGSSSQSYSAQLLASTGHPAIKALINMSGLTDTRLLFFPGGAFRLDTLYPWLHWNYLGKSLGSSASWDQKFLRMPLVDAFEWEPGLLEKMAAGSVAVDRIETPTLHITGWNDVVYRHTLLLHAGLAKNEYSPPQKLIIGPWLHNQIGAGTGVAGDQDYGPEAGIDMAEVCSLILQWIDRYLLEEDNGVEEEPAVRWFAMGENKWREAESWPLSGAASRSFYLASDGRLAAEAEAMEGSASYDYDPEQPVPTMGGVNSHIFPDRAGPRDQARFAGRKDVLVFNTAPLRSDLLLAGPITVLLHAASSVEDTDFVAKLIDIAPDGYQLIVEDGIVRARFRNGSVAEPIEPGEVYEYAIDLGSTGLRVPKGHRISLHISSSNFPKYHRNPNTGEDSLQAEDFEVATQQIFFGGSMPSRLILSLLEDLR